MDWYQTGIRLWASLEWHDTACHEFYDLVSVMGIGMPQDIE